jgi:protein transport protein DSL1/ZW10
LQQDIIRSKALANDLVRQSEAPEVSGEVIQDAEEKLEFLNREFQFSQTLQGALKGIQHVYQLLAEVEVASQERRVLDSLRLLESKHRPAFRDEKIIC